MAGNIEEKRREFWTFLLNTYPEVKFEPWRDSNIWLPMSKDGSVVLSLSISQDKTSVFLRGRVGAPTDTALPFVERHRDALSRGTRVLFGKTEETANARYFRKDIEHAFTLRSKWPEIARWFVAQIKLYKKTIAEIEAVG